MRQIQVARVEADRVTPLRELHRREMNCQIIADSFPRRGLSDSYLLALDGRTAGYGLVANRYYPDTVNEFYTVPECRGEAFPLFRALLQASGATDVRAQSNDPLLSLMLYDTTMDITSDTILFHDGVTTCLPSPGGVLRRVGEADKEHLFPHHTEPPGDWLIELDGAAVATGGALYHYNPPYGDLYMEVQEGFRRRGFGSYLLQELKRVCYEEGKAPAARCSVENVASRRCLERAGMLPCGRVLQGRVVR